MLRIVTSGLVALAAVLVSAVVPAAATAPGPGRESGFSGVSCRSAVSCVAIGVTGTAAKGAIMSGAGNGAAWKIDPGF